MEVSSKITRGLGEEIAYNMVIGAFVFMGLVKPTPKD